MPEFSDCVQPILKGKAVSEKSQTKLSRQLRAEITLFLDEHDLITTGNKGERRSMYKALGEALATKYPLLLWDEPKPESHLVDKRTHVYSLFIRRLTVARKVRKHRKMRSAAAVTPSMPTPALTKESAVAELEALRSADLSTVALDIERMKCLLEVTYEDRCKRHDDPLPQYFLLESILCIEVELRFKCKVGDLEKKVKAALKRFHIKKNGNAHSSTLASIYKAILGTHSSTRMQCLITCKSQHLMCIYTALNALAFMLAVLKKSSGSRVEI
ncbi:unnamed protein product [Ixodes pacificus]